MVSIDEIRSDDGDVINPITLTPNRVKFPACTKDNPAHTQTVEISYCSDASTSFMSRINFNDPNGNTWVIFKIFVIL